MEEKLLFEEKGTERRNYKTYNLCCLMCSMTNNLLIMSVELLGKCRKKCAALKDDDSFFSLSCLSENFLWKQSG